MVAGIADGNASDKDLYFQHRRWLEWRHTAGYAASDGAVPEADWLTGDALGWRGPWGTTRASSRLSLPGTSGCVPTG